MAASNAPEFSVSELSLALKRTVEDRFAYVRVRGEIGRVSRPRSGHVYLNLKDDKASLDGVIWKGVASKLTVQPEEGLEIIATGKLTTFPGQSKYQIVIDHMEPAGVGALMALLEERKRKLHAEGLFDQARKKPLPYLPRTIGVVTSPSGAVIRDILHRLADRFPTNVLVWPVRVQGETCAAEVVRGIEGFNAMQPDGPIPRPDLIIVARGGGSIEDLWGFNEENVARAAAASRIPLISAVGHETDTTLIDYVSDRRAPTPTGAAEMAVPVRADLLSTVRDLARRHDAGMARLLDGRKNDLRALARALPRLDDLLTVPRQRFDHLAGKLDTALRMNTQKRRTGLTSAAARLSPATLPRMTAMARERLHGTSERANRAFLSLVERRKARLQTVSALMRSLSHESVLARGFALVKDGNGQLLARGAELQEKTAYQVQFQDTTRVMGLVEGQGAGPEAGQPVAASPRELSGSGEPEQGKRAEAEPAHAPKSAGKAPRRRAKPKHDDNQGSLF